MDPGAGQPPLEAQACDVLGSAAVAARAEVDVAHNPPRCITAEEAKTLCEQMRSAEMETDHRQLQRLYTCHGERDMGVAAAAGHGTIYLAIADVAILCGYVQPYTQRSATHFMLAKLYVLRMHRHHGLADALLATARDQARSMGATRMGLTLGIRDNCETIEFWEARGFTRDKYANCLMVDETVEL